MTSPSSSLRQGPSHLARRHPKPSESTATTGKKFRGFEDEERAAMMDRIQELRPEKDDGERAVLSKIAEMKESDPTMAMRLHAMIRSIAPALSSRLQTNLRTGRPSLKDALRAL